MRLISFEGRKKIYYLLIFIVVSMSAYLGVKYLLPVCLPFIVAFLIANILHKAVIFLNKKMKINSKVAVFLVIGIVFAVMVYVLVLVYNEVMKQLQQLRDNMDNIVVIVDTYVHSVCDMVGRTFDVNADEVYRVVTVKFNEISSRMSNEFVNNIFSNTTGIAKVTVNFIVLLVFVFTAIIYMVQNMDDIKNSFRKSFFAKEIAAGKKLFKQVFLAYIKSEMVIILVVTAISTIGLTILQNPYSLTIGILVGVIDALPLLGTSVILLPWTVIVLLQGNYFYGAMLFTIFVLSYFAREFIEPRLMGKKMGINPVVSLIAVYVGYTVFGFLGMIIGPFVFLVISKIMENVRNKLENVR